VRLLYALTLTLCVLLGLSGCTSRVQVLHGDLAFTLEERAQIESGLNDMAALTRFDHTFEVVWDLTVCSGPNTVCSGPPDGLDGLHSRQSMLVKAGLSPVRCHTVAMHEAGHMFGMDHHDGVGIMSKTGSSPTWTGADQELCVRSDVCN
jgi:hypothetical protein